MTPEERSAVWAAVEALATVVAAVAAVVAAAAAIVTLRALQRDSQDRSRPFVGIDLVVPPLSLRQLELVLTNFGPTPARNVQVTFDPPLRIKDDPRPAKLTPYIERRYSQPIPVLMPGTRLANVYKLRGPEGANTEPLRDEFTATVTYSDLRGSRTYTDSFPMSARVTQDSTYPRPTDGTDPQLRLANGIEAIARGVGRA